jgi:hypothetical protein
VFREASKSLVNILQVLHKVRKKRYKTTRQQHKYSCAGTESEAQIVLYDQ